MIIDIVSDTHGSYPELEGGDLLIMCGDLTANDTVSEFSTFYDWIDKNKYSKKIVVAGNHDNYFFKCYSLGKPKIIPFNISNTEYLCDSGIEFKGLKIWGSPWSLTFPGMNPLCKAFTVDTEEELAEKWDLIPLDTDILITHTPPYGIQDAIQDTSMGFQNRYTRHCGSRTLLERLKHVRPKLHCFGHIHAGYGMCRPNLGFIDAPGYPIFVNAAIMNEVYDPVNKPIRVIL